MYYLEKELYNAHDALMCIGSKNYINDKNRLKLSSNHYFKNDDEMYKLFSDLPEALKNNYNLPLRCSYRPTPSKPLLPNIGSKEDFTKLQKAIDFSMTSFLTTGGIRGHSEKMLSNFYPRTHNMGITRKKYNEIGGFGNLRNGQYIEFSNRIKKSGGNIKFINFI